MTSFPLLSMTVYGNRAARGSTATVAVGAGVLVGTGLAVGAAGTAVNVGVGAIAVAVELGGARTAILTGVAAGGGGLAAGVAFASGNAPPHANATNATITGMIAVRALNIRVAPTLYTTKMKRWHSRHRG